MCAYNEMSIMLADRGELAQRGVQPVGVDLAVHAGPGEVGHDGRAGEVPHRGQRAALHCPAQPDDGHPVAERLDLLLCMVPIQHKLRKLHNFMKL